MSINENLFLQQIKAAGLYHLGEDDEVLPSTISADVNSEPNIMKHFIENCSSEDYESLLSEAVSYISGAELSDEDLIKRTGINEINGAQEELDAIMYSLKHAYDMNVDIAIGDISIKESADRFETKLREDLTEKTGSMTFMDEIDILIAYNETGMLRYLKNEFISNGVDVPDKLLPY